MIRSLHRARRNLVRATATAALLACTAVAMPAARAAERSRGPLRIVVPYGAGGTADRLARLLAERLAPRIDAPIVIDNRPGGSGAIGMTLVARAAADGQVLGLATQSTHGALPAFYPDLPYDPLGDFTPVAMVARVPQVLAVHRSICVRDVAGLVERARWRPGELTFGTPGVGSFGHLRMLQFSALLGIELLHVPYRAPSALIADAMSGRLQVFGDNLLSALPFLRESLFPVAVSGPQRVRALSRVPTFAETGLLQTGVGSASTDASSAALRDMAWFGLVAPKGTPAPLVERLNRQVQETMAEPRMTRLLALSGSVAGNGPPERFADEIAATLQALRAVVDRHGLTPG